MVNQKAVDVFRREYLNCGIWEHTGRDSFYPHISEDEKSEIRRRFNLDADEEILCVQYFPCSEETQGFVVTDCKIASFIGGGDSQGKILCLPLNRIKNVEYNDNGLNIFGHGGGNYNVTVSFDGEKSLGIEFAQILTAVAETFVPDDDDNIILSDMSEHEVIKTHCLFKEEATKELQMNEDSLKEDKETLELLDRIISLGIPTGEDYNLNKILAAAISILCLSVIPFGAYFDSLDGRGRAWLWIGIIFSVTVAGLVIAYFIQRHRLSEAVEIYYERVALQEQLKESTPKLKSQIKTMKKQIDKINDSIFNDVKKYCEMPLSESAIKENYNLCIERAYEITSLKDEIAKEQSADKRKVLEKELIDKKLEFFYEVSIRGESSNGKAYEAFKKQLAYARDKGDCNLLRADDNGVDGEYGSFIEEIPSKLSVDKISPLLDNFEKIKDIDTDNFLGMTSIDKLEEKTKKIEGVYKKVHSVYKEFNAIGKQINLILEYTRLCAYRNIYLGVELINYVRSNAGGSSLTTSKDNLRLNMAIANVKTPNGIDVNIMNSISDSFGAVGEWVLSSKEALEFSVENPLIALGAATIGAIVGHIVERKEAIDSLNRASKRMIDGISEMVKGYTSGKASISRAVEIIKAIVKANNGFMHIYSPLRKKVFENGGLSAVPKEDIVQIAMAINEYNKIASSEL